MRKKYIFLGVRLEAMQTFNLFLDIDYAITVKNSYVHNYFKKNNIKNYFLINKKNKNNLFNKLKDEKNCSIICSAGFPYILPDEVLKNFKTKINSHPSLLPKFKGLNPIKNIYIKKKNKFGVTLHHMTKKVDSGKTIFQDFIIKKNLKLHQIYQIVFCSLEPIVILKGMEKLKFMPKQKGDVIKTFANISKAKKYLNFKPKTIYLRTQTEDDLKISYKWRNNKKIWEKTVGGGTFKNKLKVTLKDEKEWFKKIKKKNRENLSILLENNTLIGNIYFANIQSKSAEFNIVIGNRVYWNKGYGYKATLLSLYFAKVNFNINTFYLYVKKNNKHAISIYKKIGFKIINSNKKFIAKMKFSIK